MNDMNNEGDRIPDVMAAIRARQVGRLIELRNERKRLTDWREHVKSAPMPTLVAAVAVGAVLGYRWFSRDVSKQVHVAEHLSEPLPAPMSLNGQERLSQRPNTFTRMMVNGMTSVVATVAMNAMKQFVRSQLEGRSEGLAHECSTAVSSEPGSQPIYR